MRVDTCVPEEVELKGKINFKSLSRNGLYESLKIETGQLVDVFVEDFPQFRKLYQVSQLLGTHLVEVLPIKLLLLLDPAEDFLGDVGELTKGSHTGPHLILYHFG